VFDMPKMLSWADVGITSGGTTVWEMAFMGLPCLIMCIADNQMGLAKRLGEMGAAVNQGWHECLSEREVSLQIISLLGDRKRRANMSQGLQKLVDGEGVDRVLMHLQERSLRLRRARQEDCGRIWRMACDAEARAASFSSQPITWEGHVQWFHNKMMDRDCFLFLAQDVEDIYVGQVRFDVLEGEAVISINIVNGMRGKGHARQLVQTAVEELFHLFPVRSVHAFVKQDNERSIRTFRGAGFELKGNEKVGDHIALHFEKLKPE
jgi:UDP-2,4-diacetamido-2,4,6-trideoxy-beta-L-altropyranose hydrolase